MHRQRSPSGSLLAEVVDGLLDSNPSTTVGLDAVQYVAYLAPLGQEAKLRGQVLLQGLVALFCLALQDGMDVIRKVTYENIRHAYIMLALMATFKWCFVLEGEIPDLV